MLSRNDLVKQFELITKQEITNHNAQILQTNSTLQDFKNDLDNLSKELDKSRADVHSQIKQLSINDENNLQFISSCHRDFLEMYYKLEERIKNIDQNCNAFLIQITNRLSEIESAITKLSKLCGVVDEMEKKIALHVSALKGDIFRSSEKAARDLQNFKIELESKPNEAAKVKEELRSKIEAYRVDELGILREMEKIKFRHLAINKNIEALYTLSQNVSKKMESLCPKPE